MILKKALRIAVHLGVFSLPLTYNACGPQFTAVPVESLSDSLSEPLQFDRSSIVQATKADLTLSGCLSARVSTGRGLAIDAV